MQKETTFCPLAEEGFDLAEVSFPKVDGMGRVKVRTNFYSAPVRVGLEVQAKIYSSYVEIWHEGRCVARHERCYSRLQEILDLEHYLERAGPQARRAGREQAARAVAADRGGGPPAMTGSGNG